MTRRSRASIAFLSITLAALFAATPILAAAADAAAAPDEYFDSDGVKIHYQVWGKGDPIVLVHGFTASIDANWVQPGIVDKLDDDFKVIALDLRGHGKSDKPHDPAAYGEKMARTWSACSTTSRSRRRTSSATRWAGSPRSSSSPCTPSASSPPPSAARAGARPVRTAASPVSPSRSRAATASGR